MSADAENQQTGRDPGRDLAIQTSVAVLVGGAGLLGPDAGAAATALGPALEGMVTHVVDRLSRRRVGHAAETLADAAEAAGDPVEQLTLKAIANERREELFIRTITIAQDTALRDKRRALGRALAAGIAGDDAKVDQELLFVRAIADIDTPHIRLLAVMASETISPRSDFPGGWSLDAMAERSPGLGEAVPALVLTLQSHGLVRETDGPVTWAGISSKDTYDVTNAGRTLLERLTAEGSDHS